MKLPKETNLSKIEFCSEGWEFKLVECVNCDEPLIALGNLIRVRHRSMPTTFRVSRIRALQNFHVQENFRLNYFFCCPKCKVRIDLFQTEHLVYIRKDAVYLPGF